MKEEDDEVHVNTKASGAFEIESRETTISFISDEHFWDNNSQRAIQKLSRSVSADLG